MTNPMLAELDEVVRLMEAATPDVWLNDGPHLFIDTRVQACCGRYTEFGCCGDSLVDGSAEEIGSVIDESDATYIAALHNFLRTHHATLADMAKRLEAAERRYAFLKSRAYIGVNVHKECLWTLRGIPEVIGTFDDDVDAAIDATQEGEG